MLTSPINAVISANGAALKANTATSDHSARHEPPLPLAPQSQPAEATIEPELPSNSPLTNVNAVTATVGNRTVLQELTLNVAAALKLVRRADENLTSLFLRIIATIEAMPQTERLQLEIRAGLKPLKISLTDLIMALRKPDGQEAARLTALAEAPLAMPGRTAANAATTTYLEEGTDSGHTEETLAMRAAARHSAAGQSVFSAENKMRPSDGQPVDAKLLQNQLKTMFEPGEPASNSKQPEAATEEATRAKDLPVAKDPKSVGDMNARPALKETTRPDLQSGTLLRPANPDEKVTFSSANLKLDPLTVEKIRNVAQSIADLAETMRADQERVTPDNGADRRVQTMLTLKGLAEVVTAIPAKAAELLAAVVAEAVSPMPETADEKAQLVAIPLQTLNKEPLPEGSILSSESVSENAAALATAEAAVDEGPAQQGALTTRHSAAQVGVAAAEEHRSAAELGGGAPLVAAELAQHAVPYVYAQVQPAREESVADLAEEKAGDEAEDDTDGQGEEDDEPRRRPRDEYDAIHDPLPEEEPAVVINRDSSESDRAFALYQRMGGF